MNVRIGSYFSSTAWLLDADPSLYCVSAWNDLGALHTSRDRLFTHFFATKFQHVLSERLRLSA